MRSSGAKGFPFTIPTEASSPISSGSPASGRLLLHQLVTVSQKPKSLGGIVLKAMPDPSMNRVSAARSHGREVGTPPARKAATAVPSAAGT